MHALTRGAAARPQASRLAGAVAAAGLVLAVPAVVPWGPTPTASAHSVLERAEPADGATVASPSEVRLTFNEDVNKQFATLTVLDGERRNHATGEATVTGPTVSTKVDALAPGPYVVGYRVTSADGHVVQGRSQFTVEGAAGGPSAAEPTQDGSQASQSTDDHSARWVVVGLGVALVVAAVAAMLVLRSTRRRSTRQSTTEHRSPETAEDTGTE